MMEIYHFTDTVRLPWIIETDELRPGSNRIGGFPVDFLWATTSEQGDRTSSSCGKAAMAAWREGVTLQVRFTLPANGFFTWPETLAAHPVWTREHRRRLEDAAVRAGERDFSKWRCRAEALPLSSVIAVHVKAFSGGGWRQIELSPDLCVGFGLPSSERAVVLNDFVYGARRFTGLNGEDGYADIWRAEVKREAAA